MRYYLVKSASETQAIEYDGVTEYTPPSGFTLMDEAAFATWREANPAPAELPPVPFAVGPFQIRAALILSGVAADEAALDAAIVAAVDAAVTNPAQNAIAKLAWKHASEFRRTSDFVLATQAALQMTSEQVDDLFRLAATL